MSTLSSKDLADIVLKAYNHVNYLDKVIKKLEEDNENLKNKLIECPGEYKLPSDVVSFFRSIDKSKKNFV